MTSSKIKYVAEDDTGCIKCDDFETDFFVSSIPTDEEQTCLPIYYAKFAESIKNFEVRDSDVMVCSFPRSGTTWTQEMVWLIANNLDYEGAKINLKIRFPFLELSTLHDSDKIDKVSGEKILEIDQAGGEKSLERDRDSVQYISRLKSPRFIKTHLPFSLLPQDIQNGWKSPKMIYVTRNPKDVCASYYHFGKIVLGWRANFENFCKVFFSNKIRYGPYWKHVLGYWNKKSSSNLLIISYEEMKEDLPSVIQKVADFLNKQLTESQIQKLCKHLSFEVMKNNNAVNFEEEIKLKRKINFDVADGAFMRSGTVGKYKEEMSPEIIKQFDESIKKNLDGTSFGQQHHYY